MTEANAEAKADVRDAWEMLGDVAKALTAALGDRWAHWGEGDLADGVRELARQRDEAQAGR